MTVLHPKPVEALIGQRRCPVHGHAVAYPGPGLLLGLCPGCAQETAVGLVTLRAIHNRQQGRKHGNR